MFNLGFSDKFSDKGGGACQYWRRVRGQRSGRRINSLGFARAEVNNNYENMK